MASLSSSFKERYIASKILDWAFTVSLFFSIGSSHKLPHGRLVERIFQT